MINFRFITILALRYFLAPKSNRLLSVISTFSLLGITIGVAALIVVMSIMNGFHIELTKNIIGLNSDIIVKIDPQTTPPNYYKSIANKLNEQNYITKVVPIISGQALASASGGSSGVLIKAMNIEDINFKDKIIKNVLAGDIMSLKEDNNIILGRELARNLRVRVGDSLRLLNSNSLATIFGSMPRYKDFKVAAVFSSGIYEYDNVTILMNLSMAQKLFSMPNNVNNIEIYTINSDQAQNFAQNIDQLLNNEYDITNWQSSNSSFLTALAVERTAMFAILSLIILVAAFNIISSLFMLVKDKTLDIAILRTIGASKVQILMVFITSGSIIGIIGSVLGTALGMLISYNIQNIKVFLETYLKINLFEPAIYFLYNLPSNVQIHDVALVCSMSLILSLLATIYPAYKAASLNPVEAIRHE